jgi:hypothetical protein
MIEHLFPILEPDDNFSDRLGTGVQPANGRRRGMLTRSGRDRQAKGLAIRKSFGLGRAPKQFRGGGLLVSDQCEATLD